MPEGTRQLAELTDIFNNYWHGQAWFVLSSSAVFSRTDTVTDSERFYNSILELFDDVEEQEEVNALLTWWNQCGFLPFQISCM